MVQWFFLVHKDLREINKKKGGESREEVAGDCRLSPISGRIGNFLAPCLASCH